MHTNCDMCFAEALFAMCIWVRLPKPKPKPNPPKEPPDEPNEGSDSGYESYKQGSASMLTSALLAHAQEVAEQAHSEYSEMALLLQALCDRLQRKEAWCYRIRDRLREARQELSNSRVTTQKHKNLQGQAHRYWLKIRRLQMDSYHARHLRTPRRWYLP